jgi:hypothetical protein
MDGRRVVVAKVVAHDLEIPESTYNLVVEGVHDYFVGKAAFLLHNGLGSYEFEFSNGK